jgi:hypothetical protein
MLFIFVLVLLKFIHAVEEPETYKNNTPRLVEQAGYLGASKLKHYLLV